MNETQNEEMSNSLGDYLRATNFTKPTKASNNDPDEDVTESTEGVLSDSLSDARSMHESSFVRQSLLRITGDDGSSSSCSSSTTSAEEDENTDHSLSLILTPPEKLRLDVPLHRTSPQWTRTGHDSLSFLKTIESASEDEFSEGSLEEGDGENEDEHDLTTLCSKDSKKSKLLGEGAFGQVWLVLHQHKAYALKVCSKYDLITEGAVQEVLRERKILGQLQHPFICGLVASNQDEHFLYMLQEYCAGGELFSLLERQGGKLRESSARFYISCIADALRYLHENRIIYRDLKPENVLLDQFGYPQLIDFGCAKQFDVEETNNFQTRTLCGTPRFVSPEMIEPDRYGGGHSFPTDYWALGILLYEMLMGTNPYEYDGMTEMEVYNSIVDEGFQPSLSDDHSPMVQELLGKLLVHNPSRRLGSRKEAQVLKHRWFADVDLAMLRTRPEAAAPWSPDLSDRSDTQYFDDWENVLESKFSQSYPSLTISQRHMFVDF